MKPSLLIIDDQPDSIELCSVLIRSFLPDYEARSALDGETGIHLAHELKPEVILLDVKMPGMDGFEVCRRLRADAETRDIPVLMMSGVMIGPRYRVNGLESGADGYLYKPFEPQEFVAQIRSLLRIKHLTDSLRAREHALENNLRQLDEQYRILVESTPFAVLIVQDGRIVFANRSSPALFQIQDPSGLIGQDPLRLVAERDQPALAVRLRAPVANSISPVATEARLLRADGSEFPAEEYMAETSYAGKPARQIFWIDISPRRRAEEALRESEGRLQLSQKMDALGRLSGGVAHDFNNLLTSIIGYAHMLQEDSHLEPGARDDLKEILHAAERAEHLVRHLLAFSRDQPVERIPLDLNEVVLGMDRLLRRTIGSDIELITVMGENLGSVMADAGQIEQILMNLAVNARSAMPSGGKLTIRTKRHPARLDGSDGVARDAVLLEVTDTGCGMSPEIQKHVFEPFFTTRPRGEGTGLGLATVYGIVEQSGGRIELESSVGAGTRFRIYFPRLDIPPVRTEVGEMSDCPRGSETILLVEDEPALRRLSARYLHAQGYRVLEATNGREGLRLFGDHRKEIHLVLADVVMPQMNGPDMVRAIHRMEPGMPVLFITGFVRSALFLDNGAAADVLIKPFTRDSLSRRVRERLDDPSGVPGQ